MGSWLLKDDLSEYLGEQLGKSEYLLYFRYHEGIIINFFLSVWKVLLWRMFFILRRFRLKTLGILDARQASFPKKVAYSCAAGYDKIWKAEKGRQSQI